MKKPYYDPITKETYIRLNSDNINLKLITGSVTLGRLGRPTIWRNDLGEITKTEPFVEYVKLTYGE